MLSDRELLDDKTLAEDIGMSKQEIKHFRALIARRVSAMQP